jgi:ATP-binding cassette, subfamily C (CFTR/MRP), member 1
MGEIAKAMSSVQRIYETY